MKTIRQLDNFNEIDSILKQMVRNSYDEAREERLLLCMECGDVDLYIAASNHAGLQDAINMNFTIDDCGEIIEHEEYQELMDELSEYFWDLYKDSDVFDFFPAGSYEIKGDERESETDMLGPKGLFSAPFEDSIIGE